MYAFVFIFKCKQTLSSCFLNAVRLLSKGFDAKSYLGQITIRFQTDGANTRRTFHTKCTYFIQLHVVYLLRGKSFKSTRHSRKITDEHTCTFLHDDDAVFICHSLERLQPRFVFEFEERSQFAVSSFLILALKKLQSSRYRKRNLTLLLYCPAGFNFWITNALKEENSFHSSNVK